MAVYNDEEHVATAVESVLQQSFEEFEFVVVDDGSDDETWNIVSGYATEDERFRPLRNESNQGLPASLNRGIDEARGEYVARMDGDDVSRPERFDVQVKHLDAHPDTHVVGCYVDRIGQRGEFLETRRYRSGRRDPAEMKANGPGVAHPSVMMRKSSVESVNGYREAFAYAQDLDLWVRMAEEYGPNFLDIIPEVLFEYRMTAGQYDRKKVGHVYTSFAGEFVGREEKLREELDAAVARQRDQNGGADPDVLYHYSAGRYLLDQNRRRLAFAHFRDAIRHDPTNVRGWYGTLLLPLPMSLRGRITSFVSRT